MKRYILLKDLPTFKAGEEFFISDSGNLIAGTPDDPKQITVETIYGLSTKIDLMAYAKETLEEFPNILEDWFKEIEEEEFSERIFYILPNGKIDTFETVKYSNIKNNIKEYKEYKEELKNNSNCFEDREEAERYLEYLKARAIIKRDTKGFEPDWNNLEQVRFCGRWDFQFKIPFSVMSFTQKETTIYFKTVEDIEESFKKHPDEWRTYLTYNQ